MNKFSWMNRGSAVESLEVERMDLEGLLRLQYGLTADMGAVVVERLSPFGGILGPTPAESFAGEITSEIDRRLADGTLTLEELRAAQERVVSGIREQGRAVVRRGLGK